MEKMTFNVEENKEQSETIQLAINDSAAKFMQSLLDDWLKKDLNKTINLHEDFLTFQSQIYDSFKKYNILGASFEDHPEVQKTISAVEEKLLGAAMTQLPKIMEILNQDPENKINQSALERAVEDIERTPGSDSFLNDEQKALIEKAKSLLR